MSKEKECCSKCQVDHSKCCDRTITPCTNISCNCHSPEPTEKEMADKGIYKDGCKFMDNMGMGHTFLPGCEYYTSNNQLGKPSPSESWEDELKKLVTSLYRGLNSAHDFEYVIDNVRDFVRGLFSQEKERWIADKKGKIVNVLIGIDKNECEDEDGWWETSTGAEFGTKVKDDIIQILEEK